MAPQNIKKLRNTPGFTLVELLVVIVVIAILATISVVSYTGIQSRARTVAAQSNAHSVKQIAEMYFAENNNYPSEVSEFNNTIAKLPSGVTLLSGSDSSSKSNGEKAIEYRYTFSLGEGFKGARIRYWDFGKNTESDPIYLVTGNASSYWCYLGWEC